MRYTPKFFDDYLKERKIDELTRRSYVVKNVEFVIIGGRVNKKLFTRYVAHLLDMIYEMTDVRRNKVTILYYASLYKKVLPSVEGEVITSEHVNSGFSYPYSEENDLNIVIYRREEFYKVLVHEMLHYYQVIPEDKAFDEKLKRMYPFLKSTISINEAVVELNAMILNMRIIAVFTKATHEERKQMLLKEINWSKERVETLYEHFGDIEKWKETDTHAFSYYFLKYVLLRAITPKDMISQKHSLRMTINDIENIKLT